LLYPLIRRNGRYSLNYMTILRIMTMNKTTATVHKKPSMAAVRRAVASSTAVETGQSIQNLEQKLKEPAKHRFAHVKLAAA